MLQLESKFVCLTVGAVGLMLYLVLLHATNRLLFIFYPRFIFNWLGFPVWESSKLHFWLTSFNL